MLQVHNSCISYCADRRGSFSSFFFFFLPVTYSFGQHPLEHFPDSPCSTFTHLISNSATSFLFSPPPPSPRLGESSSPMGCIILSNEESRGVCWQLNSQKRRKEAGFDFRQSRKPMTHVTLHTGVVTTSAGTWMSEQAA